MAERVRLKSWTISMNRYPSLLFCLLAFAYGVYTGVPHFKDFHFRQEPRSLVAKRGEGALLNCSTVQGSDTARIEWIKDGELIYDSQNRYMLDNGSLVFEAVVHDKLGPSDRGDYQCLATVEGLGTIVSRSATLNVASLPKHFEAPPEDITIRLNDTAMFECQSVGVPPPDVRWFRESVAVIPGPKTIIYPSGVLEIATVTAADFAQYRCEVSNMERSRFSPFATLSLNMQDPPESEAPSFVLRPRDQEVVVGGEAFLHCAANGRDHLKHPPSILWLKDGATVDFSEAQRVTLRGAGTLHIKDVRRKDAGTYTCRAKNKGDTIDTDATLTVLVPPEFKKKPTNIFAHPNSDVMLECEAEGRPVPETTWYKNGDRLYPSDYFQLVAGSNLKILGLVKSDEGIYQCFASNTLGNVQASAQLMILQQGALKSDLHKLPPSPADLKAVLVSRRFVTVSWTSPQDQDSPADIIANSVYWREKGSERERVSNTTQTEFNIQNLKPDTTYEVRVRAYNPFGASQRQATITVVTDQEVHVPSPPVNLRAVTVSSTTIALTWGPPADPKGQITHYSLIYYQVGSVGEQEVTVMGTSHTLPDLEVFREFSFRVVAHNHNGPGMSTAEVVGRTYSDTPSATPQNFTLEVSSATRIVVRWQPPPADAQNGIIVGYKIRYKAQGSRRGDTVVTDGNRNTYALTDLEKGTEYRVRIGAMTVNGTGPVTPWMTAETYSDDLDENQTPPRPARLHAKPRANSIVVQWAPPPPDSKVLVRGYVLGYGRGIADVYQVRLDTNTNDYTIKNLQPASEYVISIKAFNNMGNGPSRYDTVITSEDIEEETATPMMPPIGLKAIVLTHSTIVLTWADDSLGRSQKIVDYRYYTVKYHALPRGRNKFVNATDLVAHVDGLRPNTQYVFAVKVINGRRQSQWSMSVTNTTFEAEPGSETRDLTPVPLENDPLAVSIHWQPPQRPNGQITGYLIFYTTDADLDDRDWVVEGVVGDKLSTVIGKLTADTTYYFKVQARNSKGYGPMSRIVQYSTPSVEQTGSATQEDAGGLPMNMIIIIVACVAGVAFVVVIAIVTVFLCKRRDNVQNRGTYKSPVKPVKASGKDVPPDLWIHQPSHMELQRMDKGRRSESSVSVATSTLPRGSHASTDPLDDPMHNSDTEKRRNSFVGESGYPSSGEDGGRYQPIQPRNIIRPKPITLPVDTQTPPREPVATVTALPNGHILGYSESPVTQGMRPVYPRTQYNTQYTGSQPPRVHAGDIPHSMQNKGGATSEGEDTDERGRDGGDDGYISRIGYGPRSPDSPPGYYQVTAGDTSQHAVGRGGRGLSCVDGAPVTPTPRHIGRVKPQPNLSPYKKPPAPVSSGPVKARSPLPFTSKAPDVTQHTKTDQDMTKSLSTEELSAEMANLEGLMKDLNAITQQEFEC
ncbi:neogenin-like isoform X2 [Littorina saxatilis]|uniref:neogenin-like isoform X2 n=1 Tax=Littorina saxatilis TaxID=31220 RepID=UPI0038B43461